MADEGNPNLPPESIPASQNKGDGFDNGTAATINAPNYNAKETQLKLEARSVGSISQAVNICTAMESNNRARALRTADIQAIHDGAPPKSQGAQGTQAKAWQSNASTNWLSGIVGRQAQRFVNAIISQIYVTFSKLPDAYPDAKTKSDFMQAQFTQLVRTWSGNTNLINSVAVEDVLQGYTYAVFLDPYTWKPTMFKQDRFFVQEGAGQHAKESQVCVAKMDYRVDEFIELWKDEEAAKENGYNLDNCLYAANHATVQDLRADATTTQYRNLIEMLNEGVIGTSYGSTGARVVKTWLMWNKEYDGKVSFWLIDRDSMKLLRFSFKLYEKMDDVVAMYSFEPGNGCIHSSKGLGRKLAALAVMKELFRNGIVDNSRMASLLILQMDAKDRQQMAPAILSPFFVIPKTATISQTQFQISGEAYQVIDRLIDAWAEQAVGAYISQQLNDDGQPEKTATQATIDSKREQESADIQIRRWLDQDSTKTQIQQVRAFCDDAVDTAQRLFEKILADETADKPSLYEGHANIDAAVLVTLVQILQFGITPEEIKVWRESPASSFAHVENAAVQQGVLAVAAQYGGKAANPNVNQSELVAIDVENKVGAAMAKRLLIPNADQTLTSEASRQQLTEYGTMYTIQLPQDVSPRDNHQIHCETLQSLLSAIGQTELSKNPSPDPKLMKSVELAINHFASHLEAATVSGDIKNPAFKELEKFYDGFKKQLTEVIQIQQEAQVAHALVHTKIAGENAAAGRNPDGSPAAPAPAPAAPPPAPAPLVTNGINTAPADGAIQAAA